MLVGVVLTAVCSDRRIAYVLTEAGSDLDVVESFRIVSSTTAVGEARGCSVLRSARCFAFDLAAVVSPFRVCCPAVWRRLVLRAVRSRRGFFSVSRSRVVLLCAVARCARLRCGSVPLCFVACAAKWTAGVQCCCGLVDRLFRCLVSAG